MLSVKVTVYVPGAGRVISGLLPLEGLKLIFVFTDDQFPPSNETVFATCIVSLQIVVSLNIAGGTIITNVDEVEF
jgi:hypothetical protein